MIFYFRIGALWDCGLSRALALATLIRSFACAIFAYFSFCSRSCRNCSLLFIRSLRRSRLIARMSSSSSYSKLSIVSFSVKLGTLSCWCKETAKLIALNGGAFATAKGAYPCLTSLTTWFELIIFTLSSLFGWSFRFFLGEITCLLFTDIFVCLFCPPLKLLAFLI